ncbi:MAG: ABC transporter ATP-binding protein [Bacteroidia bacterium]|nr:ABC transporter ATP-binding protein [Bacteroidia bacterium]
MQPQPPPASRNAYAAMLRTAWQFSKGERGRYVLIYSLFAGSNLVFALEPILWGWYIDALQRNGAAALSQTGLYVAAYLALRLADWAFHGPGRVLERELAFTLSRNYLEDMYHKVLSLPVKWHQDHHSGSTISRIRKAYEALKEFFQNGFMYLHALAKFVFSFAAMLYFTPLFGAVGVLLGFLTIYVILRFDRVYILSLDEVNEKEHEVSSTLFDTLSNILTVITLRLESRLQQGLMGKVMAVFPPFRRNVRINEWKWFVADMIVGLIYVITIGGYVWQQWEPGQPFLVGGLVTLVGYVLRFTSAFHDMAWQYTDIVRMNTDMQTARFVVEAYERQHRPEPGAPLPAGWKELSISSLSYRHQTQPEGGIEAGPGLRGAEIVLRRGQRTALIGESGSGKSTLLALLRGLYEPEPGAVIRADGRPADPAAVADAVTLFPQEPEIFENTIRYNITLGLPVEEADLLEVCEQAQFAEVLAQLPKGLESNIQEKGVNLSGGQKQRLALARGILASRASDLVLLDEPTSSVDPKTELLIYDRLFEAFADKAVVSSLHRLHLLPRFDYIYVLEQGQIVEEGSFEELRRSGPRFQELWRHQESAETV